jgi:hypothetical protein
MTNDQQHSRIEKLREMQFQGLLTEVEQAELKRLIQEIEAVEAAYLAPATDRVRQERVAIELQNRSLEALVRRKESLVTKLRNFLAEAQAERRMIAREFAAVMGGAPQQSADDE